MFSTCTNAREQQNKVANNATASYLLQTLSTRQEQSRKSSHVNGVQLSLRSGCAKSYVTEAEEPEPASPEPRAQSPAEHSFIHSFILKVVLGQP